MPTDEQVMKMRGICPADIAFLFHYHMIPDENYRKGDESSLTVRRTIQRLTKAGCIELRPKAKVPNHEATTRWRVTLKGSRLVDLLCRTTAMVLEA